MITLGVLIAVLLIVIGLLLWYLLRKQPITTIIPGVNTPPRYVASYYADFDWPLGAAVNKAGDRLYVVDSNKRRVVALDRSGKQVTTFGKGPSEGSQEGFLNPLYAAVSPRGEVYVTDRAAAAISIYTADGKFLQRFVPKTESGFTWSPLAAAFDDKGNLYVTDATRGEHRVLVFDTKGTLKLKFGKQGGKNGEFQYPNGIAVDRSGKILVADSNNSRVQVFDAKGKLLSIIGRGGGKAGLSHPTGIAIDDRGRIHVVDTFGHTVQVYDSAGKFLYNFGSFGMGEGQFQFPVGIAVSRGRVYVVDRGGKRVQAWQY